MNGKIQSKHQAWGALVERHPLFQCSQCMSVSVGGAEAMSKGDSAVIGCLWEEAILLASESRSVYVGFIDWECVERCANGKIGGGERVLLMSGSHGQLYFSEPFPSPNQVWKEKQIAVKEKRVEECKASPQQRKCTKGV